MKRNLLLAAAASLLGTAAIADGHATGDAAAGEAAFRQCVSCHVVSNADGDVLAGRNGRSGPNLYGVPGGMLGAVEGFRYSPSFQDANEAGLMWDEEAFVAYVQDPTGYLREALDDNGARGAMAFRVRSEDDARNLYAYIVSLVEADM